MSKFERRNTWIASSVTMDTDEEDDSDMEPLSVSVDNASTLPAAGIRRRGTTEKRKVPDADTESGGDSTPPGNADENIAFERIPGNGGNSNRPGSNEKNLLCDHKAEIDGNFIRLDTAEKRTPRDKITAIAESRTPRDANTDISESVRQRAAAKRTIRDRTGIRDAPENNLTVKCTHLFFHLKPDNAVAIPALNEMLTCKVLLLLLFRRLPSASQTQSEYLRNPSKHKTFV